MPNNKPAIKWYFFHVVIHLQFMYEAHHTLSLEFITTSAFADFFDDFPEFLTCSKASIGSKDGKTEKASENSVDSSGGKLSKHVLLGLVCPRTFCSVSLEHLSLSSFAFV